MLHEPHDLMFSPLFVVMRPLLFLVLMGYTVEEVIGHDFWQKVGQLLKTSDTSRWVDTNFLDSATYAFVLDTSSLLVGDDDLDVVATIGADLGRPILFLSNVYELAWADGCEQMTIFMASVDSSLSPDFLKTCFKHGGTKMVMPRLPENVRQLEDEIQPQIDSSVYLLSPEGDDVTVTEMYCIDNEVIERKIEVWHNGELRDQAEPIWERRQDLRGKHFFVGIVEYKPYTFIPGNRVPEAYGFDIEVLRHLEATLNFSSTLMAPEDNVFGGRLDNGSWNGLTNMLRQGQVNFSASLFFNTLEREEAIDFSTAVEIAQPLVVMHRPELVVVNTYGAVFDDKTWLLLGITVVTVLTFAVLVVILSYRAHLPVPEDAGAFICTLVGGFLCQGSNYAMDRITFKVLFVVSLILGYVVFAVFGALFTSFLSVGETVDYVETLDDIERLDLNVFVLGDTSYEDMFARAAEGNIANRIWEAKLSGDDNLHFRDPDSDAISFRFAETPYSVLVSSARTFSYWRAMNKEIGCSLTSKQARFGKFVNSLGISKHFAYSNVINHQIRQMKETGLIDQWSSDWLDKLETSEAYVCSVGSATHHRLPEGLGLRVVVVPFGIAALGVSVSAVALLAEIVVRQVLRRK